MKITIDLAPYEIIQLSDKHFRIENFPFDIQVPERYQDLQGGDYCGLGPFQIYQQDKAVEIYTPFPMSDSEFADRFCEAIYDRYDAMKEIGWEALEQVE